MDQKARKTNQIRKESCHVKEITFHSHIHKTVVRATYIIYVITCFRILVHSILIEIQIKPIIFKEHWSSVCLIIRIFLWR